MATMKRISLTDKSPLLHVEAPGCVIHIQPGLRDAEGRAVVRIDVTTDGDRVAGEVPWWLDGEVGKRSVVLRAVQTSAPAVAPEEPGADGYARGLRDALALCHRRPTALACAAAADIQDLINGAPPPSADAVTLGRLLASAEGVGQ